MAWIIDPNFGSTLVASPAIAPFPTGGGNKVLGFGSGIVYKDDINVSNVSISADTSLISVGATNGGNVLQPMVWFIGRRKISDGSFYAGGYGICNNTFTSTNLRLAIYRYNGTLDTFVFLQQTDANETTTPLIVAGFPPPIMGTLTTFEFVINGSSISARLLNSSGVAIAQVSTTDSTISGTGSPGIGGQIISSTLTGQSQFLSDNLRIGQP